MPPGVRPRRRPWLAALLSLLSCGLGQVYCGRMRRGLGFVAANLGLVLILAAMPLLPVSNGVPLIIFLVLAPASVALEIGMIVDAFLLARRVRDTFEPKKYDRLGVFLLWMVGVFCLGLVANGLLRNFCLEFYKIPTRSECPTVVPGDRVMAKKAAYLRQAPRRGDVIVFIHHDRTLGEVNYIKRVVAAAGDTVEMRGDDLYVNGLKLERTTIADDTLKRLGVRAEHEVFRETNGDAHYRIMLLARGPLEPGAWPGFEFTGAADGYTQFASEGNPTVVPPGHCFVIGDNRRLSMDSRHFGPVPLSSVLGRVDYVIWPAGKGWARFGVLRD